MAYYLRSFVETLDQVLNPHKHYKKWVLDHDQRPQIQSLFENATFLQDFLDKSSPLIQERISSLEDRIMDAAGNAADTMEIYITYQILLNPEDQSFTIFPPDLGEVIRVFEDAKQKVINIVDASQPSDHIVSPPVSRTRYPDSKIMVGMEEDLNKLKSRLTSARVTELDVIPIVGMGGIGKTTLARILYDDFASKSHFDCCAWVTVSQTYDPQQILKSILASVNGNRIKDIPQQQTSELINPIKDNPQQQTSELITTLYKTLVGRRYLIVLDDIWSSKAWDDVQIAFARDNKGSRVIFTTRENSLVDYVKSNSHGIHLLNEDKSWELLRRKVFVEESVPSELEEIGKIIAKNCGGLPLALQIISGVLVHSHRSKDVWEDVAHNVSSLLTKNDDQFAGIFSWSFSHLPHYLKPCFLYMGAFPEDYAIRASRIIKLWVSEGFLYPVPNKSLEEAAVIHLNALVDRNLIFVRTRKRNGKAKSYGIHDLLRDLCLKKAEEKKFLYVKGSKTNILHEKMFRFRCVSVHQAYGNDNAKCYSKSLKLTSLARSFIITRYNSSNGFESCFCSKSSLLRVMDVFYSGSNDFHKVFLHLVNLRCLTIRSSSRGMSVLTNLQTLIVWYLKTFAILEHLPQLRHLKFLNLEDENDTHSLEINPHKNLQSLSYVPCISLTYLLDKIPNLRKLVIEIKAGSVFDLGCLQRLESLKICQKYSKLDNNITFPQSLKKLKICGCKLSPTIDAIGSLPGLQVLIIKGCKFENNTWNPTDGEFCQLQYLEITNFTELENWSAAETHFPVLRHLVLRNSSLLHEIPNEIGEIETLETIELDECKASVFDSARTIQKKQSDFGNTLLLRLGRTIEDVVNEEAAKQLEFFENKIQNDELTIFGSYLGKKIIFPHSLKKLKLNFGVVSQTILNAMGIFTQLEVVILENCYFEDSTWKPSEGQFCNLEHLQISKATNLENWFATEIHFPVLQHLVIRKCHELIEIPIGVGRIETLKIIVVEDCKPSLVDSARIILEKKHELGNTQFHCELEEEDEDGGEKEDKLMEVVVPELDSGKMKDLGKAFENFKVSKLGERPGTGEGLKRLKMQVSSSSFWPSQDFFLTSESLGLDSRHSYSSDNRTRSFASKTSAGGQRRRNSNESAGTIASRQWRRKQRKATSLKPFKKPSTSD